MLNQNNARTATTATKTMGHTCRAVACAIACALAGTTGVGVALAAPAEAGPCAIVAQSEPFICEGYALQCALDALGISWTDVATYDVYLVEDDFGEPDYYRIEIWLYGTCDSIVCWPNAYTDYVTEYAI